MRNTTKDRTMGTLLVAVILCAVFTALHCKAESRGGVDGVTVTVRRLVLAPGSRLGHSASTWASATFIAPFHAAKLARQNTRLRFDLAALKRENLSLRQQADDAAVLRQMLDLKSRSPWNLRPGFVVAVKPSPTRDNALVQFGGKGVAPVRGVVIAADGSLVGQIVDTGPVSNVLLLSDPLASVGVRVLAVGRPPQTVSVFGICQGQRGRELELVDMPADADVRAGDTVVTSGLGSVFPGGIPVGCVTTVRVDTARSLKMATVATVDDFNNLQGVFLRQ